MILHYLRYFVILKKMLLQSIKDSDEKIQDKNKQQQRKKRNILTQNTLHQEYSLAGYGQCNSKSYLSFNKLMNIEFTSSLDT